MNYASGTSITNTGTIGLSGAVGTGDLKVQNFSGTTQVVIDVQGYYVPAS